jgi:hypothetical protein
LVLSLSDKRSIYKKRFRCRCGFKPRNRVVEVMADYSSHDWRKHTDDAVIVDNEHILKVNDSRVLFKNPKTLKEEEVDVSRLIRVFVNNRDDLKRSVK